MNCVTGFYALYVVSAVLCSYLVLQNHLFVVTLTARISVKLHQMKKFQIFSVESHIRGMTASLVM